MRQDSNINVNTTILNAVFFLAVSAKRKIHLSLLLSSELIRSHLPPSIIKSNSQKSIRTRFFDTRKLTLDPQDTLTLFECVKMLSCSHIILSSVSEYTYSWYPQVRLLLWLTLWCYSLILVVFKITLSKLYPHLSRRASLRSR